MVEFNLLKIPVHELVFLCVLISLILIADVRK